MDRTATCRTWSYLVMSNPPWITAKSISPRSMRPSMSIVPLVTTGSMRQAILRTDSRASFRINWCQTPSVLPAEIFTVPGGGPM